ncbi:MAG: 2-oxoacid:acceptor oxidoreductase family protein [Desulforhopalus sp.]
MCNERILCAGFGGQGVMSLGQLLAYAGMIENKHVTWLPSYGPEMRGGTAYCNVVVSDCPVGSPIVTGNATCAILMNLPSLVRFEQSVTPGGIILFNSSLTDKSVSRRDVHAYSIAAGDLARDCGSLKAANMVMLGAYLALTGTVNINSIIVALAKVFSKKSDTFVELNIAALQRGKRAVPASEHALEAA